MCLAMNMAKMAQGRFSRVAIEDTHYLIKNTLAEAREETKRGVEISGYKKIMAVMERFPAIIRQNHMAVCLPYQHGPGGIPRHPGCTNTQVILHKTNMVIQHQIRRHLHPERHLCHLVPLRALKDCKLTLCQRQN
jgi:hypothetical protein